MMFLKMTLGETLRIGDDISVLRHACVAGFRRRASRRLLRGAENQGHSTLVDLIFEKIPLLII